jgi:hypothetical protein
VADQGLAMGSVVASTCTFPMILPTSSQHRITSMKLIVGSDTEKPTSHCKEVPSTRTAI